MHLLVPIILFKEKYKIYYLVQYYQNIQMISSL